MKNKLEKLADNEWAELVARFILGLTFVYASYHKILYPGEFAKIIYGYELFPGFLINLIAIILPFIEFISGMALIAGIYPRSAAFIINIFLILFIIALSVNLIRGHEFDCGCFSAGNMSYTSSAGLEVFRDILLLGLGSLVLFYRGTRRLCFFSN